MKTKKAPGKEQAVVYARYSSHNQGEQSIEGQLAAAKIYAEAKGYTIVHEYIDRAVSGRTDNRDEFQRMLTDCAKKQFTVIIVWKVDRFGRNREEITFNKYRAKKHGVRVEYVAENVGEGPEGVILESVLEGMAEYYSLQLSQNVSRGLHESAKKYHMLGGTPPIGYRRDAEKKFEIDPDTAPIVQLIFNQYKAGATTREIADYLEKNGYRTARGTKITHNSIRTILKNEKYIGVYTFKDIIREEGVIPPIIDTDTFRKVQEMLARNQKMPSNKWVYLDYLLTGKLFCGKCGAAMAGESGIGANGQKYSYYGCYNRKTGKGCDKENVRQDLIENAVLEKMQEIIQDDELMDFIAENTWQYYLDHDADQEQIRIIEQQITDADKAIGNLVKSIEAGVFNDAIKARMDQLEMQKTALQKALADKELERGFKLTRDHITFFLDQFRNLDYTDRECQKRLIDVFVNAIFLYDDEARIAFNFGGSDAVITLDEINQATAGKSFARCASYSGITRTVEKVLWTQNVFIIDMQIQA